MTPLDLTDIARRLAAAEHELKAARSEIRAAAERARHHRYGGVLGNLTGLAMLVVAFALGRSITTEAQGGQQALTVKAPFTVVDSAGLPIIRVTDKGPRGIQTFNPQGKPDSDGSLKTVKAPFAVVDAGGSVIFKVEQTAGGSQGAYTYNRQGHVAAQISASPGGSGVVAARDGTAGDSGFGRGAGLLFDEEGNGMLQVKGNDNKLILDVKRDATTIKGDARFVGQDEHPTATISASGISRRIVVFNASGGVAANLTGGDRSGILAIRSGINMMGGNYDSTKAKPFAPEPSVLLYINDRNSGAISVRGPNTGRVLEADEGGYYAFGSKGGDLAIAHLGGQETGRLELANPGGDNVVEAGMTKEGRGIVRTGPYVGGPVGLTGLPSVIVGKLKP